MKVSKEQKKYLRRKKLNAYCQKITIPAKVHGAHMKTDEKKLQNSFSDRYLSLRYRVASKEYEIWHMVPNELYKCLIVIGPQCNIAKGIELLNRRQVSNLQRRAEYLAQQKEDTYQSDLKVSDASRTIANAADMHRKGKLSVAFHGE